MSGVGEADRRLKGWLSARLTTLASGVPFGFSVVTALLVTVLLSFVDAVRAELVIAVALATIALAAARGVYRTRMVPDTTSMVLRLLESALLAAALVLLSSELIGQPNVDVIEFLLMSGGAWSASVIGLFLGTNALKRLWGKGYGRSRAIVIGTGRLTDELLLELRHRRSYGVDVVGVVHLGVVSASELHEDVPHVNLEALSTLAENLGVDRLIIGPSVGSEPALVTAARWAVSQRISVFVVPRLFEMGVGLDSLTPDRLRGYPLVRVQRSAHPRVGLVTKRLLDVAVSFLGLAMLSPVMALCGLAVRLSGPGPILFAQERVGEGGDPITVYKFRSMTVSAGSDTEWTAEQRVTRVGSFLRRTSLDELPQLFSILRGDMSLVGPRPERPAFVEEFSSRYPSYDDRHRMRVGLTGLAQVVGLVGDTSIEERIKYDNLYIDQWSFGGDLQIIVKTLWAILRQPAKKAEHKELEILLADVDVPSRRAAPDLHKPQAQRDATSV